MNPIGLKLRYVLWAVLQVALNAQPARPIDPIPLGYWAAPLYWHAGTTSSERAALTTAAPTLPSGVNPLVFVGMTPCRVVDTRASQGLSGPFGPPSLVGGASRTFPLQASTTCTIPLLKLTH